MTALGGWAFSCERGTPVWFRLEGVVVGCERPRARAPLPASQGQNLVLTFPYVPHIRSTAEPSAQNAPLAPHCILMSRGFRFQGGRSVVISKVLSGDVMGCGELSHHAPQPLRQECGGLRGMMVGCEGLWQVS